MIQQNVSKIVKIKIKKMDYKRIIYLIMQKSVDIVSCDKIVLWNA